MSAYTDNRLARYVHAYFTEAADPEARGDMYHRIVSCLTLMEGTPSAYAAVAHYHLEEPEARHLIVYHYTSGRLP